MSVKLFLLGRPGSGKSTAFRHIERYIDRHYLEWSTTRFDDYSIVQEMFLYEKLYLTHSKGKQFCEAEHGGFDVLDFSVLDTALKELEKQVRKRYTPLSNELIIIEFARDNYKDALKQFSPTFLKDAYFLFIEQDLETCIQRVKNRVTNPPTRDNHFVSTDILVQYYGRRSLPPNFKLDLHIEIDKKRVKSINSRGSIEAFSARVKEYIDMILTHESFFTPLQAKIPEPKGLTRLLASTHR